MRPPRRLLVPLALLAGGLAPASAPGATGLGGVSVSPASIDVTARAGDALPSVRVGNDTGTPLDVRVRVVPADQDLSGLPSFSLTSADLAAGRRLVAVEPARFTLPAGTARPLSLRLVAPRPIRSGGSYGVVVVEAVPARPAASDASGGNEGRVDARLRLTANLLVVHPGEGPRRARAVALRVEQAPGEGARALLFHARVRGTGRVHVRPRVRLRVRDADGRLVARGRTTTGNVLPGADREMPATVTTVLPAGRYVARVVVDTGGRRSVADRPFTLVGPNELPSPALAIRRFDRPEGGADAALRATLVVVNTGTAAAAARGEVVLSEPGGRVVARRPVATPPVAPRGTRTMTLDLPAVGAREHVLTARLLDGDREIATRTVVFTPVAAPGPWTRFLDWAGAHVPLLLGGFAVVLVLVAVGVGAYVRRLRRALGAAGAVPTA